MNTRCIVADICNINVLVLNYKSSGSVAIFNLWATLVKK